MSFNDIGWLVAFALATLTIFQLAQSWADRKFKHVHERIEGGDKWFNEEIKSLREMVHRYNNDLYGEINRIEERIEKCENCSAPKEKNYYNTDAGCCKSKQFVQD